MIDLQKLQKEAWETKLAKKFNTTDVHLELCLIQDELTEVFRAYQKKLPVGEEIADVVIYCLGLAEMLHVDLESEIVKKMERNKKREYQTIDGVLTRTKEA